MGQYLNNIKDILKKFQKMGGKAVKDVRPLDQDEVQSTYEWVEQNILPLILIEKEEAMPIGSFGKKPKGEKSGDIDVAISAKRFLDNGIKFEEVCEAINHILNEEHGLETTLLKGFDQVSVKVPVCGDESKGYAQVDLMPSPDLQWAKFMYHSPNLAEGESKYKGAVRNALLMALVSESTKDVTKLFEGQAEEYTSLAIRFPTGVWNIKRSFMGKKGKLVKTGSVLESEFITRDPQDVIDIALGEGFKVGAANSFETLWEIIHRKDFIHKNRLNEIMTKFQVNLKSMMQNTPEEAIEKYSFLNEDISDVLKPKDKEEILKNAKKFLEDPDISMNDIKKLDDDGVLKLLSPEQIKQLIFNGLEKKYYWSPMNQLKGYKDLILKYITQDEYQIFLNKAKFEDIKRKYNFLPTTAQKKYAGQSWKELNKVEKEFKFEADKDFFEKIISILSYDLKYKSILRIVHERIKRNEFVFFVKTINFLIKHRHSHYPIGFVQKILKLLDGSNNETPRSEFAVAKGNQFGLEYVDDLVQDGILRKYKIANKQIIAKNEDYKDSETYVAQNYYKFMNYLTSNIEKYGISGLNESKK